MEPYKFQVDHVVIVVPSLARASEQYRSLGFTVTVGGDNGPTHSALIPFDDGTYIELISVRSKLLKCILSFFYKTKLIYIFKPLISGLSFRFACWLGGPNGIRDWCVRHEHLDRLVDALNTSKLKIGRIEKYTRTKPNLEKVEWFLVAPFDRRLPFFIEDITSPTTRIPSGDQARHSNGCLGVSRLLLDDAVFSSIRNDLAVLRDQAYSSESDSAKSNVQLVGRQSGRIAVELKKEGADVSVLEMRNSEFPQLRNEEKSS